MREVLLGLLSNGIFLLLGFLASKLLTLVRIVIPSRIVWQLVEPKKVIVCSANSTVSDTGEYVRSATGIGQVRALGLIVTSMKKAYREIDLRNVFLSTDQLHERLENDIILLGGAKNNELTALYLKKMENYQPVIMEGSTIIWRKRLEQKWVDYKAEEFHGQVKSGDVISDYGLIMRTRSPFTTRTRTVVLLAGSHTYGTVAASKFFTENLYRQYRKKVRKHNVVFLVSAEVINEHPTGLRVIKHYEW